MYDTNDFQIRLKKLQEARAAEAAKNGGSSPNNNNLNAISTSVAFLRAKKDLQEYEDIPGITVSYDRNDPMNIKLVVKPDEGYYKNGVFNFECKIPKEYPNSAPEFRCLEKIYHPNIDVNGSVCLNILRNDWKPTLTIQLIFAGILHLFLHPNPNDPLNKMAANDLSKFPDRFRMHVRKAMEGGYVNNEKFQRVLPTSENYGSGVYNNRNFNNYY